MNPKPQGNCHIRTLGATLLLVATGALAATAAPPEPAKEVMVLVQATTAAPSTAAAPVVDPAEGHLSTEAGVRRAAAQGIDSLRRYVNRTRIIYNYRVVDFVTPEMSNDRR